MTTKSLIGESKLKPSVEQAAKSQDSRDLVKLNQIVELVLYRAGAVGALSRDIPLLGRRDFTKDAIEGFRKEILTRRDYWLHVFREVKVILEA